ncbi:hypothetical protein JVU11DRAFT_1398 [Chiua virens]|nr:hypothetical protein JVU11DRAFT_1398 [Chiua virens]
MNSDVDRTSFKRSPSTPSPPPIKRAKSEHDDITLGPLHSTSTPAHCSSRRRAHPTPLVRRWTTLVLSAFNAALDRAYRNSPPTKQARGGPPRGIVSYPDFTIQWCFSTDRYQSGDGIVLNWVRHESGSVVDMRSQSESHKVDDTGILADNANQKLRFPVVSTSTGFGTGAADAIIIDSDEDKNSVPSQSRPDGKRPIDHGTSLHEEIFNDSGSDVEFLSWVRPENQVEDVPEASYHSLVASPRELSSENFPDTMSSPPLSRALTKEAVPIMPSGLCSDGSDMSISDSEDVRTDKEVDRVEDIHGNGTPVRQAKLPSVPSLQSIRNLIASRRPRGDPEGVLHEGTDVPKPKASQKQARKDLREDTPAITSSESDEELECQASDPQVKRVPLPKTVHGRPRRLLMPNSAELPLVAVTMRGDCHFIERKKKFRISGYSLPNTGAFRHVADVCMVGNTAVLGCDKGTHQISFVSVAGKPKMIDVAWSPHSSSRRSRDQDAQKRGVSCLAAIHAEDGHIKFLSGGYDGTIHEWTVGLEMLNEPRSTEVASHGTHIDALAYRGRDRSVATSAGKRLHITDLSRRTTKEYQFSNDIQQIHMHPQEQLLTLFERLLIGAGKASPSPPVGPALGARGVKSMDFCKEFNARTAHIEPGVPIPTMIHVQPDRTFTFFTKTPPTTYLLKQVAGLEKGPARPGHEILGTISLKHVYEIAKIKARDEHLKHLKLESIASTVIGTARTLGLQVVP